jgi:hypothetical protein
VDSAELIFGALIVLVLLGVGGFYTWGQVRTLRGLGTTANFSPDERRYVRRQAWRRLTCSVLMVVFAVLLITFYSIEQGEPPRDDRAKAAAAGKDKEPSPAEREFVRRLSLYSLVLGTLLVAILCLAFWDMLATRRYTLRQLRQINDLHDAFEQQAARLRHPRNGQT